MLRIADQVRLWTTAEVEDVMAAALAIVEALGPDDDLRVPVFTAASGLLAQKHANVEQVGVGVPTMQIPRGLG